MKKLFYLFLLFPLLLASCSSDDDDDWEGVNSQNIIGRWQVTESFIKTLNTNYPEVTEELQEWSVLDTPMLEFQENGNLIDQTGQNGYYQIYDNGDVLIELNDGTYFKMLNVRTDGKKIQWDQDIKNDVQDAINQEYNGVVIYDFVLSIIALRR